MRSWGDYYRVYFPSCEATSDINTKITLATICHSSTFIILYGYRVMEVITSITNRIPLLEELKHMLFNSMTLHHRQRFNVDAVLMVWICCLPVYRCYCDIVSHTICVLPVKVHFDTFDIFLKLGFMCHNSWSSSVTNDLSKPTRQHMDVPHWNMIG